MALEYLGLRIGIAVALAAISVFLLTRPIRIKRDNAWDPGDPRH